MKKNLFILFSLFLGSAYCQRSYWQQQVNFHITASLNDSTHTIDAEETITYINNSPDTLNLIWFHLWPNAYKNDKTTFSEQLLANGRKDFYFSKPEDRGYINRLRFTVDNVNAVLEDDSTHIDIVKVRLPKPLYPGGNITIRTPFHVKLPFNFSRGGHVGHDYQVTQWYPKPAVYDEHGWHPMPYVDQGEFFSEFGNYEVKLTVPAGYVVAATGILQDKQKSDALKSGVQQAPPSPDTWHFKQDSVHDFAWFASKEFSVLYDTVVLPSKKIVDVFSYFHAKDKAAWQKSVGYAKDGIRQYSKWLGDYPYSIASVVQGSKNENSGGMEYPTITLITTQSGGHELDATIVHEVGHNWFYGALASNERDHPWMDEGMNTYYQKRYELEKYGTYNFLQVMPKGIARKAPEDEEELFLRIITRLQKDQPIETPSLQFSEVNYGAIAYIKASRWMSLLENKLGKAAFDTAMQEYYRRWKFKHPYPADFQQTIQQSSGRELKDIFDKLHTTGVLTGKLEKRSPKLSLIGNLKDTERFNYLNVLPVAGYNYYDKLMVGAMVHNYQLPLNNFQFLGGILYATGSGKLNSFGRVAYNIYKRNYHLETAISAIGFTRDHFTTDDNQNLYLLNCNFCMSIEKEIFF